MPPPPDPNAKRRNARVGPVLLPAGGRTGDTPPWPLVGLCAAEAALWADLWMLPQAVAWERLALHRTVARYVRVVVVAELPGAPAPVLAQATALEDRLGLNPKALRALMWDVPQDEVAERREERAATTGRAAEVRRRIRAVG